MLRGKLGYTAHTPALQRGCGSNSTFMTMPVSGASLTAADIDGQLKKRNLSQSILAMGSFHV